MNIKRTRLYISISLFIAISLILIVERVLFVIGLSFTTGLGTFSGYAFGAAFFFITNIFPFAALLVIFVYYYLKPAQLAFNELSMDRKISLDLYRKARKAIITLPKLIVIINVFFFLCGLAFYIIVQNTLELFHVIYSVSLCVYVIALSIVSSFMQIGLLNIILNQPRELLNIHSIDRENQEKQLHIKSKNILLSVTLMVYALTLYGIQSFHEHIIEVHHAETLMIYHNKSLSQAKKDESIRRYKKFIVSVSRIYTADVKADQVQFPGEIKNENKAKSHFTHLYIFIFVFTFIAFMTQYVNSEDLVRRISMLWSKLRKIVEGGGDLSNRISIIQFDEVGELTDTFNQFLENLRQIMISVAESAEHVHDSANELASSVEQTSAVGEEMMTSIESVNHSTGEQISVTESTRLTLSEMIKAVGTISDYVGQQSLTVEETSSSISEMVSSIQSVSQTTNNAQEIANNLVNIANQGGMFVKKSLEAIKEIESSSQYVGEMVTVISQIAEQTNLLAMNAAIEAAHAGSAGKGFAVVADEVRKLAENSARSAGEIVSHIKVMTDQINNGVKLAEETGMAFELISKDINETSTLITEVSSAMKEQNVGASEVLVAIGKVVESTNEIKTLVQEEKSNSESVSLAMANLVNASTQINLSVEEQSQANQEIVGMVERVNDVATINKRIVDKLQRLLSQFNLDDRRSDQSVIAENNDN
ncbi:MAG: methyl-accepting chemotaxis protein [Spirochaetota bacterium]|nr:methyl-accepting chemotaxis protein [Spirochaetota bacterium]